MLVRVVGLLLLVWLDDGLLLFSVGLLSLFGATGIVLLWGIREACGLG